MILPKPAPPVSQAAFAGTFVAPLQPWLAYRGVDATIKMSGGKGGGGGDNPAKCASQCQYCAPNQICRMSTYCQNRYGAQFPWGCYY